LLCFEELARTTELGAAEDALVLAGWWAGPALCELQPHG